ncbi:hypothetical protein SKAU_G00394620 [Synaphobranchus kaupii]|uniref:Homeobox domain-containing protein n=1 Tax=Synaphobranchus kaupii TaxID=118154 RepID=A0A9Q1IDY6_SYNKA|nr:hypothetical protein SKAU_G00394620 [Synaphobranchus kaupii]
MNKRIERSLTGENDENTRHAFEERAEQETLDHGSGRKKKTRTVFSRSQVFQLESTFDMKRYLSTSERALLAAALHLTETQHNSREFSGCDLRLTTTADSKNDSQDQLEDHEITRRHETDYRLHKTEQINTHCYNATAHTLQVCREDALKTIDACPRTDAGDSGGDDGPSKNKISKKNKGAGASRQTSCLCRRAVACRAPGYLLSPGKPRSDHKVQMTFSFSQ